LADQVFDLFGHPVDPKRGGPGRPGKVVTEEKRNQVKALLAEGATQEEIAVVLGLSVPTLRKYYFRELKERHAWLLRLRSQMVTTLMQSALVERNMSAMRMLIGQVERMERMGTDAGLRANPEEPKPEARGKKLIAADLAEEADRELQEELSLAAGVSRARH
jgi:hypothetical protein